jgi:5-methylcytosine-specific restriction endonuclease McrA
MRTKNPIKRSVFICKWCGKQFETWTYRQPNFCSRQCMSEYAARQPKPNARRPESFIVKICEFCGKEYKIHKCQDHRKNNTKARFCSVFCKGQYTSLHMRGNQNVNFIYGGSEKRGQNWNSQKRAALKRDNNTCQICGIQKTKGRRNDVHHIIPFPKFDGDFVRSNDLSNLITLCRQCHCDVESGKVKLR